MDGVTWRAATQVRGLLESAEANVRAAGRKTAVTVMASRSELRMILRRIEQNKRSLPFTFHATVSGSILATLFLVFAGVAHTGQMIFPHKPVPLLVAIAFLPAVLLAAAAGHFSGNLLLRLVTRQGPAARRCLALHLPWNRCPRHWPLFLRNWIYGGDWLIGPELEAPQYYVRAFVTGPAPRNSHEEVAIWMELLRTATGFGGGRIEVGRSTLEMVCLDRLPDWTRSLEPGTSLPDVVRRLGQTGRDWASSLLQRAVLQMPGLAQIDLAGDLRDVSMELHYCTLSRNREGLLVFVRPRRERQEPAAAAA